MININDKKRMNNDIHLADSLQRKLGNNKSRLILDSGYGIDAVTKSKVIRFHHDLDVILLVENINKAQISDYILKEISDLDNSNWESKPTSKSWIWIREKEKAEIDLPRQINIHIVKLIEERIDSGYFLVESSAGIKYKLHTKKSRLLDLSGNSHIFTTLTPEEYLTNKIRLIPKYSPTWNIREQDVDDFRRLFGLKSIDLRKTSDLLKEFLENTHSKITISYYWKKLIEKYPEVMSKKQLVFVKVF